MVCGIGLKCKDTTLHLHFPQQGDSMLQSKMVEELQALRSRVHNLAAQYAAENTLTDHQEFLLHELAKDVGRGGTASAGKESNPLHSVGGYSN